ncbi:hypothetical protein BDF22DRAFT_740989 [Syncephalis plumigaleata]|nr:hypothetical protein BDF22DRAFT_740989 [Syncephalis plumigaleata]
MQTAEQIAQLISMKLNTLDPHRRQQLIVDTNASFLLCIQLPSGHEVYYTLNLRKDNDTVDGARHLFVSGAIGRPDVTISLPITTWSDIVAGRLCGPPSNQAGRNTISGNKLLAYKLNRAFQSLAIPLNKM